MSVSPRLRELFALIPVSLLVTAGFTAVLITRSEDISNVTITYGAIFLGLCVFAHLFIRARLPDADPYMFPLAATLASFGLVEIYRIDPELAREQAQWFVVGLAFFCATIVFLRDHHALERYRYTIAAVGIGLLVMPRLPGIGEQINGAYLAVKLGPIQFQPAEFAKLAIIVFLASYLRETGEILVRSRVRPLPIQRELLMFGLADRGRPPDRARDGPRHRRDRAARRLHRLPRGGAARAPVAEALRPPPAGLGPGDADAARDP